MQNWPFPIFNGERTEASKLLIAKGRNPDKNEGSYYLSLESAVHYVDPINTNEEKEALF
jgi:hypothetical protein